MADVLLVHVREDETLADSIGISLERSGLTVARGESVFDVGDEVPCVVVLWSDVSTRSSMVPGTTNLCTSTFFFCPIRNARSVA